MIRSTKEAIFRLRSVEKAIIEVAITNWRYEPLNQRYVATVEDYAVLNVEGSETRQLVNTKEVYYSNAQIDGLFSMIGNPINVNESYSSELIKLIAAALLYVTQTDLFENGKTIYGLDPQDWVINEAYEKNLRK